MTDKITMTAHQCEAPGCDRPTQDMLCSPHAGELQERLLAIVSGGVQRVRIHKDKDGNDRDPEVDEHPGLWDELQTTITRQHKLGGSAGTGAHSAETPVPYHRVASEVAARLANEVSTWARDVAELYPHLTLTATSTTAAARWLATVPGLLAEHPAADELYAGITRVVRDAERVIDRAPDRIYAGPCLEPLTVEDEAKLKEDPDADVERCPGHLYAKKDEDFVRCRECQERHDVAVRQAWLSNYLAESLVTAAEAAPVLSWFLDKEVKVDTIHKWKLRGRLAARGQHQGRPLYRFKEVEALAREVKTRASKSRNKEGSAA